MPPLEETDLNQTIVVWPRAGFDRFNVPVVGLPRQMPCRWIDSRKEVVDPQSSNERRDATAIVLQEVARESLVWLGSLDDLPGTGTSAADVPTSDLYVVTGYDGTPDIKGRFVRRSLTLMRYSDKGTTSS